MILVVGGLGSGKRRFVREQFGYLPEEFSCRLESTCPVLYDLQDLHPLPNAEALEQRAVVICNEIGCGVVPISREERTHREEVGHLCCQLALRAEAVYRVNCGLGMRLK